MWINCPACEGTGSNGVEDPCLTCGGNGAVFKECCGCRDCEGDSDEYCRDSECPKCSNSPKVEVKAN